MTTLKRLKDIAAALNRRGEIERLRPKGHRGIAIDNDPLAREWQRLDDELIMADREIREALPLLLNVVDNAEKVNASLGGCDNGYWISHGVSNGLFLSLAGFDDGENE